MEIHEEIIDRFAMGDMARTDGYSDGPFVAVRVFDEGDSWAVDLVDAHGDYSEAVWNMYAGVYPIDRETAIRIAPEMAAANDAPGVPVQIIDG